VSHDGNFEDLGSNQPLEPLDPFKPFEPFSPIKRRPMPKRPFEVALREIG
jgi:hypothetical protein